MTEVGAAALGPQDPMANPVWVVTLKKLVEKGEIRNPEWRKLIIEL